MRQRRLAALSALVGCLVAAPARADITATVTTPSGRPVAGAQVFLFRAPAGQVGPPSFIFAGGSITDATGRVTLLLDSFFTGFRPPPGTGPWIAVGAQLSPANDPCRTPPGSDPIRAATGPVDDGADVRVVLPIIELCAGHLAKPSAAFVDNATNRVLASPGATIALRSPFFADPTVRILLADETELKATRTQTLERTFVAPRTTYRGPLLLRSSGTGIATQFATLLSARIGPPPAPPPGNFDLEAVVDTSGSNLRTDPRNARGDALGLLAALSAPTERIGVVTFSQTAQTLFDLTQTSTAEVVAKLARDARRGIRSRDGADHAEGLTAGFAGLTTPGLVEPLTPKGLILITDDAPPAGAYRNDHLRFAFNGTPRTWPICVIGLGKRLRSGDVALLRRVAGDTGGAYISAPSATQLVDGAFQCRARITGQTRLPTRTVAARSGVATTIRVGVDGSRPVATFFLATPSSRRIALVLRDPSGRACTRTRSSPGCIFRAGPGYAMFIVRRPRAGKWSLTLRALGAGRAGGRMTVALASKTGRPLYGP